MSLLQNLISPPASSVAPSAPARQPAYQIKETTEGFDLTVHLPGVAKSGLEVTAEDGVVRITGQRAWQPPSGWTSLHRETGGGSFELALSYDHSVDPARISAVLQDGVLRVSLPKHEALKPRKIAVS